MKKHLQFVTLLLLLISSGRSNAQGVIFDQENNVLQLWNTLGLGWTFGQEFVPAASSLDCVELWIHQNGATIPGSFQVLIREDSISGNIIGTSAEVTKPMDDTADLTRFNYSATVALVPGSRYVLQLVYGSGDYWNWNVGSSSSPDGINTHYPHGRMIVNGPADLSDLTFRTGSNVPEPASGSIFLLTISSLTLFRQRK